MRPRHTSPQLPPHTHTPLHSTHHAIPRTTPHTPHPSTRTRRPVHCVPACPTGEGPRPNYPRPLQWLVAHSWGGHTTPSGAHTKAPRPSMHRCHGCPAQPTPAPRASRPEPRTPDPHPEPHRNPHPDQDVQTWRGCVPLLASFSRSCRADVVYARLAESRLVHGQSPHAPLYHF